MLDKEPEDRPGKTETVGAVEQLPGRPLWHQGLWGGVIGTAIITFLYSPSWAFLCGMVIYCSIKQIRKIAEENGGSQSRQ